MFFGRGSLFFFCFGKFFLVNFFINFAQSSFTLAGFDPVVKKKAA